MPMANNIQTQILFMKTFYTSLFLIAILFTSFTVAAQSFNWSNYTTGSKSYRTASSTTGTTAVTMQAEAVGAGYSSNFPAYSTSGSIGFLALSVDWANKTTTVTYTLTFSTPLSGVTLPLYDVDQNTGWDDKVTITGANALNIAVYPTITAPSYAEVKGTNENIIEGKANNGTFTNAPAYVNFGIASVKSITIVYSVGSSSPSDPATQIIGIGTVTSAIVLPVELKDFKATAVSNNVSLKWTAENQVKFSHFEIERSATGNGGFEKIATVNATADLSGSYAYTDNNVKSKMTSAYYRLKMVDIDRNYTYSYVVTVRFGNGATVDVRPTLVAGSQPIAVTIAANNNNAYSIKLFSLDGRMIAQQKQAAGRVQFETANLAKGMYVIAVEGGETVQTVKVMVQ
jgi:hypothetical protein